MEDIYGNDIVYIPSPDLATTADGIQWAIDSVKKGGQDGCDAAALMQPQYEMMGFDTCDVMWTGRVLFSMLVAAPADGMYVRSLNRLIREVSPTSVNSQYHDIKAPYKPLPKCSSTVD